MTEFGSGIHLDSTPGESSYDWDFVVDETGDLKTSSGLDELLKDVAFITARRIQTQIGEPTSPTTLNRIDAIVKETLREEPRVDRIMRVEVTQSNNKNQVNISANVVASGEQQELVFSENINV